MRPRRLKFRDNYAVHHVISRTVAGEHLLEPADQEVLRKQIHQMAGFCGVEILTFCILSNHFHLLVRVPPKRELSDAELVRRYAILYGADEAEGLSENLTSPARRDELRTGLLNRMHDLSFFMKELKMRFTIYYNDRYDRFGTLWAERFKSLLVESRRGRNAVIAVAAYIDLNAVRAGLCSDPKDHRFSGYGEAIGGSRMARDGLIWITERKSWSEASKEYRMVLYGAGTVGDKRQAAGIEWKESRETMAKGGRLSRRDLLRCRVRYFSDGLALGSARFVARMRRILYGDPKKSGQEPPVVPAVDGEKLFVARRQRAMKVE